jgi:RecA/RadA recombinase
MAMLYRIELGDAIEKQDDNKIKQVNKEVAKQMRILAEIARKKNIPVLITNQVYKKFVSSEDWIKGIKGESNIVGGDLFKYWSKCILELQQEGNKRTALLLKHRSLPQKQMGFVIRNTGIFKRRWI